MKLVINLLSWKFLSFVVVVCIAYYLVFNFSIFPVAQTEVLRVTSPDGKLDAVYIQSAAGAMASGNYLVFVLPKGSQPDKKDSAVFWAKRTFGLDLSWQDDGGLLIQFSEANIKHFQSYLYPFPKDTGYKIEIKYEQTLAPDRQISLCLPHKQIALKIKASEIE